MAEHEKRHVEGLGMVQVDVEVINIEIGESKKDLAPEPSEPMKPKPTQVQSLKSKISLPGEVELPGLDQEDYDSFGKAVFEDKRWKHAMDFLTGLEDWSREKAASVLRQGAKPFGIWHLSNASLEGLVDQLMHDVKTPSPALRSWISEKGLDADDDIDVRNMASIKTGQEVVDNAMASRQLGKQNTMEDKDVKKYFAKLKGEQKKSFWRAGMEGSPCQC